MIVNTLGHQPTQPPTPTVAERMWQFLPAGVSVLSLSALVYYHLQLRHGPVQPSSTLQYLYANLYAALGLAPAVMFFLLVAVWSVIWSVRGVLERPLSKLVRLVAMTLMIGIWVNLGDGGVAPALHKGSIGAWFAEALHGSFGYWPSLLLVGAMTIASVMLATDFLFADLFEQIRADASRRPSEDGVEPQVSEHLKTLAPTLPVPPSTPSAPTLRTEMPPAPAAAGEDPSAAFAAAIAAAARAVADVGAGAKDAVGSGTAASATNELAVPAADADETPTRPTTYEERRRLREARRWGRVQDDGWVPSAPESQEIDNAEAQVAAELAGAAGPASDSTVAAAVGEPAVDTTAASGGFGDGEVPVDAGRDAATEEELPFGAAPAVPDEDLVAIEPADELAATEPSANGVADAESTYRLPQPSADHEVPTNELAPAEPVAAAPTTPEPIVAIPRPEPVPADSIEPVGPRPEEVRYEPVRVAPEPSEEPPARQQSLFGDGLEQGLVQEAIDLVVGARRASATFLQRKLRIDYALAVELLAELAARGVVALEGDASHGRVLQ